MNFILRIEHTEAPEVAMLDVYIEYEEWSTLGESEARAKVLRKQGAKVAIYQEL